VPLPFLKIKTEAEVSSFSLYEVLLECSQTVIVVTASVKEDERGGQGTFLQAYCISLPCGTAL
jgi:hypothetical protein